MADWTADGSGNIGVPIPSPRMKMPSCWRSIGRVKRILTEKARLFFPELPPSWSGRLTDHCPSSAGSFLGENAIERPS